MSGFGKSTSFTFGTGGAPAAAAPATGFGAAATPSLTFGGGTATGFGGFGSTPAAKPATTATGFGGAGPTTAPIGAPSSSGFGFGTPAAGTATTATPNIGFASASTFGTPSATGFGGGFGGGAGSTFGTPSTGAGAAGGFGSSSFGAFGQQQQQPQQQQFLQQQMGLVAQPYRPEQAMQLILERLVNAYGANTQTFRHVFYNLVNPKDLERYQRPAAFDQTLWNQAVANMTDEEKQCMAPVQAIGFEDLSKRVEAQAKMTELHTTKLKELDGDIESLREKHMLITHKVQEYRRKQREQMRRLLAVIRNIELVQSRGNVLSTDEEALRTALSILQRDMNGPNMYTRKLQEIAAQIKMKEADRLHTHDTYAVSDKEAIKQVQDILRQQQESLKKLFSVVSTDKEDLDLIRRDQDRYLPSSFSSSSASMMMY